MAQRLKTDWVLFTTIVLMVAFGLVMIYSASSVMAAIKLKVWSGHFLVHQLVWAVVSFIVLMYFKRKDYRVLRSPRWAFAGLGITLMLLVMVYVADARTHRWFRLGSLGSIQPSEFAKPALALFLAWFITERERDVNDRHTLIPAAIALAVLAFTVVVPDLGTAIVLVAIAAVMFFVAGLQRRYFITAAALGIVLAMASVAAKPYRLARVVAYVDPDYKILDTIDPNGHIKRYVSESITTRDPTYQPRQSRIAVGSGGAFGVGLMRGRQKILYLPEAHTDYIYAVVGEELGLFGCTAVLAGFLVIMWRGYRLFWIAPDDFGRYLALGLTSAIVVQALVNISVVLDIGPTKGIPLPMISNGGSSLLSTLIMLGILLSISERAS